MFEPVLQSLSNQFYFLLVILVLFAAVTFGVELYDEIIDRK